VEIEIFLIQDDGLVKSQKVTKNVITMGSQTPSTAFANS
jgi:hypothetical protein